MACHREGQLQGAGVAGSGCGEVDGALAIESLDASRAKTITALPPASQLARARPVTVIQPDGGSWGEPSRSAPGPDGLAGIAGGPAKQRPRVP